MTLALETLSSAELDALQAQITRERSRRERLAMSLL
jgi:hypothetical protein